MLYAAGVPNREMMKNAPHVGIATVWWEGNPVSPVLGSLSSYPRIFEELQLRGSFS